VMRMEEMTMVMRMEEMTMVMRILKEKQRN
jgi:hypothetical protein